MPRSRLFVRKITSVGLVDRGANTAAEVVLYKRDVSAEQRQKLADEGKAMPDGSYPIATAADLKNAVQSFGRANNPAAVKAHIKRRAKALGMVDALPKEWSVSKREDLQNLAPTLLVKMDGMAASFAAIVGTDEARHELNEMVDALMNSFCSILCDATVDKQAMLTQSASEFAAAVSTKATEWFSAVTKAGAKMSAARMEKFKSAMATLQDIMAEVEGMMTDTKKSAEHIALEKRATDAEATVATLTAENTELAKRITALEAKVPKDEDVLKSVPEAVRKMVEDSKRIADEALAKAAVEEDKRVSAEFLKRAEDLITKSCVPAKADEFGLVLKRIHQGKPTEADLTELDRVLKAMGEQIKVGALFAEQGRASADTPGSAIAQINALATELRKTKPTLSAAAARIEVRKSNPELAQRERTEQSH